MRIAMLSWESMHSIAIGGLAPHVSELSTALMNRGHEVHLFTRMGMHQTRYELIGGVHYHRCPFEPHPDFVTSMQRMCNSLVWHLVETEQYMGVPFDIVHGHDWLTAKALVELKNGRHRPTVFTVHSTEFGRCGNSLWDDEQSGRIRAIEWEGTYVADRLICVSKALAKEVERLYTAPADKIMVVYNGVDANKFSGAVDVAKTKKTYSIGLDDPMVLFAGRLTWQKGPDILVEAIPQVLRAHPRAKIVFAGDGDMRLGLEQRAAASGLSDATRFLGYRNGAELISLFKSADVVCVPSRNEPFGIVILEAWSATKPVVATRIGGPKEFVRNEHNGLIVETGTDPVGQGISALLADADSAREMGRQGRREVELRFAWEHAATATEKVYEATLSSAVRRGGAMYAERLEEPDMAKKGDKSQPENGNPAVIKHRSASLTGAVVSKEPTQDEIRARAHSIYLARRGVPGDPVADWLQAERELRQSYARDTEAPMTPPTAGQETPARIRNGPRVPAATKK